MKIAVIGAGAMGSIYGGHLSLQHEVFLIDKKKDVIDVINTEGLKLNENGRDICCYPKAITNAQGVGEVDLVILFVKASFSQSALEENRELIGDNTYVMTLQNGAGHEEVLRQFVPLERIIIGTTEDNGMVLAPGYVRRGGNGKTNIGMLVEHQDDVMCLIKNAFDSCGFHVYIYNDIQRLVWDKLFVNVSLSAVTGILQVPMGYITENPYAWNMTVQLIKEAIIVADAMDMTFNQEAIIEKVRDASLNSPKGLTSLYKDIKERRKTEVDVISGFIVSKAQTLGIQTPTHSFIVNMIHALEQKED